MNSEPTYHVQNVESWSRAKDIFRALGPDCIFRGQSDSRWEIGSTLERRILSKISPDYTPEGRLELERLFLRTFRRDAPLYRTGNSKPDNMLNWWAEMQHYGMATRLVDFTWSPYVACFFAFETEDKDCDRAIWALDDRFVTRPAMEVVLEEFGEELDRTKVFSSEIWEDPEFVEFYIAQTQERRLRLVHFATPDGTNERLASQQGLFVMPSTIDVKFMENLRSFLGNNISRALVKIVVPNELRTEIMRELILMNITRASLFPGLEGYARTQLAKVELSLAASQSGLINQQRGMRESLGLPK